MEEKLYACFYTRNSFYSKLILAIWNSIWWNVRAINVTNQLQSPYSQYAEPCALTLRTNDGRCSAPETSVNINETTLHIIPEKRYLHCRNLKSRPSSHGSSHPLANTVQSGLMSNCVVSLDSICFLFFLGIKKSCVLLWWLKGVPMLAFNSSEAERITKEHDHVNPITLIYSTAVERAANYSGCDVQEPS
jgi:hypothetical protein